MRSALGLYVALLAGCVSCSTKSPIVTLPAFEDTYRWHSYHLTQKAPLSADGVFRLIGVAPNGDVEVLYTGIGSRVVLKKSATAREIATSKMPMRIECSDFPSQSADIARLTTN